MNKKPTKREEFRNEMAIIVAKNHCTQKGAIATWREWDEMFDAGYRKENAGEAYREWLRCS